MLASFLTAGFRSVDTWFIKNRDCPGITDDWARPVPPGAGFF